MVADDNKKKTVLFRVRTGLYFRFVYSVYSVSPFSRHLTNASAFIYVLHRNRAVTTSNESYRVSSFNGAQSI